MKKIIVGSKNPTKVNAVKTVLKDKDVRITGVDVPSQVANQPFSDEETKQGALNRAKACLLADEQADVGIGLEGGVVETAQGLMLCNWGALVDLSGRTVVASGAKIVLPEKIATEVRAGEELGQVMARFTADQNTRKKAGAMGIFTAGYVTREELFTHLVKLLIGQYVYQCEQ